MVSVGHIVINTFVIDITRLSLYIVNLTSLRVKFLYFGFYNNLGFLRYIGSIRYTKSVFRGFSSDILAGNLPYLTFYLLYVDKYHNY